MADSKVSDLIAATSVNPTDVVYLVQSSTDKKLSISTLLANLPSVLTKFSSIVALGGTSQSISNTGAINATSTVTYLTNSTNSMISIDDGTYDGQIKIVIFLSGSSTTTLSVNLGGAPSVQFSTPGHTAILLWVDARSDWYVLGGTAQVTYP
jgi:hypothetical protein